MPSLEPPEPRSRSAAGASAPDTGQDAYLSLIGLTKSYHGSPALRELSAEVRRGELVSLLGPSGSGKTTALRIIGGFLEPEAGRVIVAGHDITLLPPHRRNIGTVFQSYGLFPHLTVQQNVEYGLRMRRVPRTERHRRVADVLTMVRLSGLDTRYPRELSGGQQQRVAIARALVIRPDLLLLDEPMSNLDAKLRVEMRQEIRRLQRETRLTTILVTHDQDEALSVSDRIMVMNDGRIEQVGTPTAVYEQPETPFVAHFMGEANFLEGTLGRRQESAIEFRTAGGLCIAVRPRADSIAGGRALLSLRPESIDFADLATPGIATADCNTTDAVIEEITYRGAFTAFRCRLPSGDRLRVMQSNRRAGDNTAPPAAGDVVRLQWNIAAAQIVE